ncbi:6353_t:CDS:2 [Funneliformis geosporum]|uniref:18070_t:CDS:1 n=1 Tax=Funneliformis geosporum TaxID=1117311 RepID=A0A9W4SD70_9GLOM|nr:18070_t:CDS:2 [Funneliformis geosporum]CAI2166539.1 6353_t:CDS:2 [Funneliformis geosporum]
MTNQKSKSNRTNFSRACVFIDSSNPSMPYQVIDSKIRPLIKLPFPPVIDPADLVQQVNEGNIPARAPNAFIIYRKAFIDAAHIDGYHLPMRIMSSMASQSWEQETDTVKSEYRRLANEAFNLRNELYPKSGFRRKRAKWNIVSFQNKNKVTKKRQKWNIVSFESKQSDLSHKEHVEPKEPVETQLLEVIQQIPSPKQSTFSNFVYHDLIPSPEPSITSGFSPEMNDPIDNDLDFCIPEQSMNGNFEHFNVEDNFLNYYQIPTFVYNDYNEHLSNESILSQEYFNGSVNFQPVNVEPDALHLYENMNYFSDGLGISNSESGPSVEYFR